jgi:arginyl-tRNA synthetase
MNLKQHLITLLEKHNLDPKLLEVPSDRTMGDLALPCFMLAKEFRKAPQQIASDLAEQMVAESPVEKIIATGPYINFFFDGSRIAEQVVEKIVRE